MSEATIQLRNERLSEALFVDMTAHDGAVAIGDRPERVQHDEGRDAGRADAAEVERPAPLAPPPASVGISNAAGNVNYAAPARGVDARSCRSALHT